jgi:MFS superfamily sulfate permease-like transporter
MTEQTKNPTVVDPEKTALNKRLETMAWGLFLILWGGSMFWPKIMPNVQIPEGLWSIGIGLILLGLNAARYFNQIRMSGFTTALGIISIIGGVVQLFGVKNIEGAFLLIILGAYLIFKQWFDERKLFGKAEEG